MTRGRKVFEPNGLLGIEHRAVWLKRGDALPICQPFIDHNEISAGDQFALTLEHIFGRKWIVTDISEAPINDVVGLEQIEQVKRSI